MPVTNAVILIPDISGFTQFFSEVEIEHAAEIIDLLLVRMIEPMHPYMNINEIEGDALLGYRSDENPDKQRLLQTCHNIFTAFETEKARLITERTCKCNACTGIDNLTVKFVGHYGKLAITKIQNFEKAFGLDMIIAHRLLKNSLPHRQYVLFTEALLTKCEDAFERKHEWTRGEELYEQVGTVAFSYASLPLALQTVPAGLENFQTIEP